MSMRIYCFCGEEVVAGAEADWVHEDGALVACDPDDHATTYASPDAERLYTEALAALPAKTHYFYADRDDRLTNEQLQVLLQGGEPYESKEFDRLDEIASEQRHLYAAEELDELLGDEAAGVLLDWQPNESGEDGYHALLQELMDRDQSDPIAELLRSTPSVLVRYRVEHTVEPWPLLAGPEEINERVEGLAEALGLTLDEQVRDKLTDLVHECSYGGQLYLFAYLDPEDALRLSNPDRWGSADNGHWLDRDGTVTFAPANVVVVDHLNGSGSECEFPSVTVPWRVHEVCLDAKGIGHGYSWDEICGLVISAYRSDFTFGSKQSLPASA